MTAQRVCPKCSHAMERHSGVHVLCERMPEQHMMESGSRINASRTLDLDVYACNDCGYVELYQINPLADPSE